MNDRNRICNFLYSVIIYFIILTAIVSVLYYLSNIHASYEFVLIRMFLAVYLASTKRIKIFKENKYE